MAAAALVEPLDELEPLSLDLALPLAEPLVLDALELVELEPVELESGELDVDGELPFFPSPLLPARESVR
ncbi:MAG TPA: hypothetical protein VF163_17330 [Micromonosporaceae bacterium]